MDEKAMTEQWEYVDAHRTRQEREWEQLVKESKCWDCGHLKRPPAGQKWKPMGATRYGVHDCGRGCLCFLDQDRRQNE